MDIQWSLVLFTALTGMGGCLFVCVAADEFLGRAKQAWFPASIAAFALAVVGGLASVTHLSHPDRMLAALSHPTSGIFTEALLVGCLCACIAVYVILLKRESNATARKVVAVLGAVFGLLLSFMAGESYLMSARPNWSTQLLPLGYLLTALPEGIAAWLVIAQVTGAKGAGAGADAAAGGADAAAGASAAAGAAADAAVGGAKTATARGVAKSGHEGAGVNLSEYAKALAVAAVLAAVGVCAYVLWAGPASTLQWVLFVVALVGAGVIPAVCGAAATGRPAKVLTSAACALACSFVGAVAYRCIMWLITVPVANLFLGSI